MEPVGQPLEGRAFCTIAELAVPQPDAAHVLCTGYDVMPHLVVPYTTNLPLARAVEDDVLLVHTWEGGLCRASTAARAG